MTEDSVDTSDAWKILNTSSDAPEGDLPGDVAAGGKVQPDSPAPGVADEIEGASTRIDETAAAPVSEKQLTANRKNARNSTGPKTKEGKARSAANAVTHGAYVVKLPTILYGRFKEDADQIHLYVDEIVSCLAPRDVLEAHQAHRVAMTYLGAERIDAVEAAAIGADTTLDRSVLEHLGNPVAEALNDDLVEVLACVVVEGNPLDLLPLDSPSWAEWREAYPDINWMALAGYLRISILDPGQKLLGLWDDDHHPSTEEQWRTAALIILRLKFPTWSAAEAWMRSRIRSRRFRNRDPDGGADGAAADRVP